MKVTWKESTDGTQWQIILESQNVNEDIILEDMYHAGGIQAFGETNRGRSQLYLSTRVGRVERKGVGRREE